jgi:hypothetical protein
VPPDILENHRSQRRSYFRAAQDGTTELPRARQAVSVRGEPPVSTAPGLIRAFRFPPLRAVLPDLLDADQVSNRAAHHRPGQARRGTDPQGTVHRRSVRARGPGPRAITAPGLLSSPMQQPTKLCPHPPIGHKLRSAKTPFVQHRAGRSALVGLLARLAAHSQADERNSGAAVAGGSRTDARYGSLSALPPR